MPPGVHRVVLPLPFELNHINVYLVRLEDGFLLIDCGIDDDASFGALSDALRALEIQWSAIRQILLTHLHPDHTGLATRILSLSGARLLMHEEDVQHLAALADEEERPRWLDDALIDAGVPQAMIHAIEASFAKLQKSLRRLDPDWRLRGGETIAALGGLEVIWTPGHSPGHVCLYSPQHKTLFSGDHILENITPNIGWHEHRDALGEYLESLERLEPLEINLILPSHGAPFNGHRDWIRSTRAHHEQRCSQILAGLRTPRTVHDLVGVLWGDTLSPFHYRFAVFEVLAHLEYMKRQGLVGEVRTAGLVRWSAV